MADTGCQSCLAGSKVVRRLGVTTENLIPVSLKMHAVDNHDIGILGATILKLSGKDSEGKERQTRKMVYMINSTESCSSVGKQVQTLALYHMTWKFPAMVSSEEPQHVDNVTTSQSQQCCNCPKRTKPPPLSTSLPFTATDANREKLQQHLLDYYASSSFNVCEHQLMPLMDGPPMIDGRSTSYPNSLPSPLVKNIPEEFKEGLETD